MKSKINNAASSGRMTRLVRLAEILCTSIDPEHAERIDEVYPGFYRQYQSAQKRLEEAEENQNFTVRRHRLPNVIAQLPPRSGSKNKPDASGG